MLAMLGMYVQALVTGKGPVSNWLEHLADPSSANGFAFATKFAPTLLARPSPQASVSSYGRLPALLAGQSPLPSLRPPGTADARTNVRMPAGSSAELALGRTRVRDRVSPNTRHCRFRSPLELLRSLRRPHRYIVA